MESVDQAETYKEFFFTKFKNSFIIFLDETIDNLNDEKIKNNLIEVRKIINKLDYHKIIIKYSSNMDLYKVLQLLNSNNNVELLKNNEKYWTLIPKININKILLNVNMDFFPKILKLLNMMFSTAFSYSKICECDNNTEFDPYKSIGEISKQLSIDELYNGVEIKTPESYEFIINQLLQNFNLNENLNSIDNNDINNATTNINNFLNSKTTNSSTNIISNMLNNIKDELINLKNDKNITNENGMKKIYEIAQKISSESLSKIDKTKINPLELWDTTAELATATTGSDTIELFGSVIREQIIEKLNIK